MRRTASWALLIALSVEEALGFGRLFKGLGDKSDGCPPDNHENCATWAAQEECTKDPVVMKSTCPTSCGCDAPVPRPRVPQRRGCKDDPDYNCTGRAANGECDFDKGEMLWRCPSACHVCQWESVIKEALGCEDTHASCQEWARHGECQASAFCRRESITFIMILCRVEAVPNFCAFCAPCAHPPTYRLPSAWCRQTQCTCSSSAPSRAMPASRSASRATDRPTRRRQ